MKQFLIHTRQTQRRIELFDEQTSNGEYKYNMLVQAIDKAEIPLPKGFEISSNNEIVTNNETNSIENDCVNRLYCEEDYKEASNSSKFLLTFDYDDNTIRAKWLSSKMKTKTPDFPLHILNGLFQKFKGYNHGSIGKRIKSIVGFTEIILPSLSHIVRACPYYRGEKNWFDWVSVSWENYGSLDCQCLLFMDFSTIVMEEYDVGTYSYEGSNQPHEQFATGKAVLIHSIKHVTIPSYVRKANRKSFPKGKKWNKDCVDSHLVRNRLVKFSCMEDVYHIISVENICSTAFVIPYDHLEKEETYLIGRAKSVMVLKSMSLWNKFFIDYDDEEMISEAETRIDNSVERDDERCPYER